MGLDRLKRMSIKEPMIEIIDPNIQPIKIGKFLQINSEESVDLSLISLVRGFYHQLELYTQSVCIVVHFSHEKMRNKYQENLNKLLAEHVEEAPKTSKHALALLIKHRLEELKETNLIPKENFETVKAYMIRDIGLPSNIL